MLGVDKQGILLTASADKSIRHWQLNSNKTQAESILKYLGHTDCVRGLALNPNNKQVFFSCGNDGKVLQWNLGHMSPVRSFQVCDSFLYSINMLNIENNSNPEECYFITSSEDRSVRVHHSTNSNHHHSIHTVQTISVPCQTVWHVICLPRNGNIVAACSDGSIRVFTQNEQQMATKPEQEEFERELSQFSIPVKSDETLSKINREELPGIEALATPGRMEGQPLMINNNNDIEVYQWDSSDSRWVKIGVAVGSSDAAGGQKQQKVVYLGKEYDYVFDIELDDAGQKLKLPYNLNENPYLTAQNFIHQHELSQYFLDQIAQFIIKNTQTETINQSGNNYSTYGAYDPFTGGSAYSSTPSPTIPPPQPRAFSNSDPFTGSSAYTTDTRSNGAFARLASNDYYPHMEFIYFEQKNLEAIFKKLRELQQQISVDVKSDLISDKSNIELLENLMNYIFQTCSNVSNEIGDQIDLLFRMIDVWPKGKNKF